MSQIRIHSSDPRRPTRSARIEARTGWLLAAALGAAGLLVVLGLFGAPALISDLVRSADRIALRETARRGAEAFASVRRRHLKLVQRLAADELFLARVATLAGVALPEGFPAEARSLEEATALDIEADVVALARRVREFEVFRRKLAGLTAPGTPGLNPARIPSRSPVEPTSAVPVASFGPRVSPLTHRPEFYPGLGLAVPAGTTVVAPAEGVVVLAGPAPSRAGAAWRQLGTIVILAHDERTRTVFGHLEKVLVRPRKAVRRGDPIARAGQSGWATSPQLHYEVRRLADGRFLPLDPRLFVLDADWIGAAEIRVRPLAPPETELPPKLR